MVARRQVSPGRKLAFYLGYLCMAGSALITISLVSGPFESSWSGLRSIAWRAASALGCLVLGLFLRMIGIRGLAGSLVVLDPPRARKDLEPWSRAAGGLLDAAVSEAPALKGLTGAVRTEVKVRCRSCGALSDEDSRYCGRCGKEL